MSMFRKLYEMGNRYFGERQIWQAAGEPIRKPETIKKLYQICSSNECGQFERVMGQERCAVCECFLHPTRTFSNKLAWSTTRCPLEEPKWVEEEGYQDANLIRTGQEVADHDLPSKSIAQVAPHKDAGCGCNK